MTAGSIRAAMRARYPSPEWAIFFEVGNGTGSRASRYCDAMAMGLWPSRGLAMHGFEIKASRHDWQREIANPAKAEEHVALCDFWWIVAPKGIVREGELPPTWGLIEFADGKLKQTTQAPKLIPKDWDRQFIAALLRRAGEHDQGQFDAAVAKATTAIRERAAADVEYEVKNRTRSLQQKIDQIAAIEKACGIDLSSWRTSADTGHAIRLVEASGVLGAYAGLQQLHSEVRGTADRLARAIAEFEAEVGVTLTPARKMAAE